MNNDNILLYLDVDVDGNILPGFLAGTNAFPDRQYDYFFFRNYDEINVDEIQDGYAVINGELVRKEA